MSVSRIFLVLAWIAIVAGLVASQALAASPAGDEKLISVVHTAKAADKAGQGWFGG